MPTVLDDITAYKLKEIAAKKSVQPIGDMEVLAREAPPPYSFFDALKSAKNERGFGLICEIKRASPSKGLIRTDFDPQILATAYQAGGATCISVLTDTPSFQGEAKHLTAARRVVSIPILRKDFMFDPYQVVEARSLGADCILVILAAVTDSQASELDSCAREWQMDVLLEIHDTAELERALRLPSPLIGINNRNLRTFETELDISKQLAPLIPSDRFTISESGISSAREAETLLSFGISAFLIGEKLMQETDVEAATHKLLSEITIANES